MLRLLGPLAVDGAVLGSARQRRLLAALALRLGDAVPTGVLVAQVWGARPPADPSGAVHTLVARLRRMLPPTCEIATAPDGYRLVAARADVDVTAFTDLLDAGDPGAALALWRGTPFTELDVPEVVPEVARLEGVRRRAVEELADGLTAAGRPAAAVAAVEPLVQAEPLRESAVGVLMRALVADGRQAEALAAYTALRGRLVAELGLEPSPELRELQGRVLRQDRDGPAPPAAPADSFVGRETELAAVVAMLGVHRLITLTGPGGVGKTRLARHVVAGAGARFPDGVVVVELAEGGARDVEPALAGALRITGSGPLRERIVAALAARRLLLVLDNCEHVVDEAAALAEVVVAGAPGVTVLATSREALRVAAEQCLPIPPMPPDVAAGLLADRVHALDPGAEVPGPLAAQLCARLDGLPLALELAAPRVVSLGMAALDEALDRPLDVLRGGRRTAAPRHRSLREVVAWSHGLLDRPQQQLFDHLAVFAGPVERAAVTAVCGDAGALPELVERSLVVRRGERFGMLETLRAFGRARLATDPAARVLRVRHAAWAAGLATELRAARRGPAEADAVRRFDEHLPDLRRAAAWLGGQGPPAELYALITLFAELGYLRCRVDLADVAEQGLRAAGVLAPDGAIGTAPPGAGAEALFFVASACWQRGELDRAAALGSGLVAAGAPGFGHEVLANVRGFRGELDEARRAAETALAAVGDTDDELCVTILVDLLLFSAYGGADDDAQAALEARLAAAVARTSNPSARALAEYGLGERLAAGAGPEPADRAVAEAHLVAAVRLAEEVDTTFVSGIARHTLLTSAVRRGSAPLTELRPLLEHWYRAGSWTHLWVAVRAVVEELSRLGRHAEAAVLLGALRASPHATPAYGADADREHRVEQDARASLGAQLDGALAEGAALPDPAAFRLALAATRAP